MMYMMINPGYLSRIPAYINEEVGKAVLGGAFYSLLIGYLVVKLLRKADGTRTDALLKTLRVLFAVTAVILVFSICYIGIGDVKTKLATIQSGNTDPSVALGFTNFFVILRYVFTQLPVFMELLIFILAMRLCDHLREDRYGDETISAAKKLASFCKKTVVFILLGTITLNLAQILFAGSLVSVDFLTTLPLDSIIVALVALLLTRFFTTSRELAQDNQMFI
jgi:cation transport ATPase